jgi:hypothetical protein
LLPTTIAGFTADHGFQVASNLVVIWFCAYQEVKLKEFRILNNSVCFLTNIERMAACAIALIRKFLLERCSGFALSLPLEVD